MRGPSPAPASEADNTAGLEQGVLGQVLGYQITLAGIATRELFSRHIGTPLSLKPVDYTILMLLLANDGATQKQLALALSVSAPKLTILLDRLQQRGLLERVRSEADRRSQQLHLTDAGLAIARKAQRLTQTMEQDLLVVLSTAERAMLIELLRKVAVGRPG